MSDRDMLVTQNYASIVISRGHIIQIVTVILMIKNSWQKKL